MTYTQIFYKVFLVSWSTHKKSLQSYLYTGKIQITKPIDKVMIKK